MIYFRDVIALTFEFCQFLPTTVTVAQYRFVASDGTPLSHDALVFLARLERYQATIVCFWEASMKAKDDVQSVVETVVTESPPSSMKRSILSQRSSPRIVPIHHLSIMSFGRSPKKRKKNS